MKNTGTALMETARHKATKMAQLINTPIALEFEIYDLIVDGGGTVEIARELNADIRTVKQHIGSILASLCDDEGIQSAIKALY